MILQILSYQTDKSGLLVMLGRLKLGIIKLIFRIVVEAELIVILVLGIPYEVIFNGEGMMILLQQLQLPL